MTAIEWTERTWNPIVGCSVVSPGCTNCYAMRQAARIARMNPGLEHYRALTEPSKAGPVWTGNIALAPDHILTEPLRRRKPTTYFVNSMGDLFHENVPDEWIDRVFAVMALCPQHTFQVLTKRSKRMLSYILRGADATWPLPNVWLGVSTEDQSRADERIPDLLDTPAAVRFVSAEPLLGPVVLTAIKQGTGLRDALGGVAYEAGPMHREHHGEPRLDWVIVGGESGPSARPMHPDWLRALRDQCQRHGTAFFFKQWGEWVQCHEDSGEFQADEDTYGPKVAWNMPERLTIRTQGAAGADAWGKVGKARAGRQLDGRTWDQMPSAAGATTTREVA